MRSFDAEGIGSEQIAADKIYKDLGFERIGDRLILTKEKYMQIKQKKKY